MEWLHTEQSRADQARDRVLEALYRKLDVWLLPGLQHIVGYRRIQPGCRLPVALRVGEVDAAHLTEMFREADALGMTLRPMHVYGVTCTVGETGSFVFHQITSSGEVLS